MSRITTFLCRKISIILCVIVCTYAVRGYEATWFNVTDGELYVSSPIQMQMYVSNMIYVQTTLKNIHIRLATKPSQTTEWINHPEIYDTKLTGEGIYEARIPYYIPFYDPNLNSEDWHQLHVLVLLCPRRYCPVHMIKPVELQYTVNPISLFISAEMEKSVYYPGESVRGRFHALSSEDTWHMGGIMKTPEYYVERLDPYFKRHVRQSGIMTPFSSDFICSSIYIYGPDETIWKKWYNLTASRPIYFKYDLDTDASKGIWSVEIECINQKKRMLFKVEERTAAPFLTHMMLPSEVSIDSPIIRSRVCARSHTGTTLNGEATIMICVCDKQNRIQLPINPSDAEDLFDRQYCPAYFDSDARKCAVRTKKLRDRVCENFEVSTATFSFNHLSFNHQAYYVLFCHQVISERTREKVSKCEASLPISGRAASLSLDLDYAYRRGLPIHMVATLTHPGLKTLAGHEIEVEISQLPAACAFAEDIPTSPDAFVTYFARVKNFTSDRGEAVFIFPPVRETPFLQVRAFVQKFSLEKLIHTQIGYAEDGLAAQKILKPWPSTSGALMQVWLGNQGRLRASCKGDPLPVRLLSNRPLTNKTIWLEGVFSGLHLVQRFPPVRNWIPIHNLIDSFFDEYMENPNDCVPQDDELRGHYECEEPKSDRIICHEGWEGDDCLNAICSEHCHPAGSWCNKPGECQCKSQWTGKDCAECTVCMRDLCSTIDYLYCVCEMPSVNYTCEALTTVKQKRKLPKPRLTIYERTINVTVIDRYMTGAYVTFNFFEPYGEGKWERISAGVFIETSDCYPPTYYAPRKIETVETNDTTKTILVIRHPKDYAKSVELDQCHFRTVAPPDCSDLERNQLDQPQYIRELQKIWQLPWDFRSVDNPERMFQSAGLIMNSSHYLARVKLDSACPNMVITTDSYPDRLKFDSRANMARKIERKRAKPDYVYGFYQPQWIFNSVNCTHDVAAGQRVATLEVTIPTHIEVHGAHYKTLRIMD
ncbi:unnamed protein product [Echinostoma caproni]|uniref:EGF-like domain-containing protein n=1 Tax=Echinostoma caproni TaxID=27848 RepID=A0A183AJM8_9TREM|nr:unnamed protein product [Echinostoma caproni]